MAKEKKKRGPRPGFWVKFYYDECVLCGHTDESREFVYDRPKPENPVERYEYSQHAHQGHFM